MQSIKNVFEKLAEGYKKRDPEAAQALADALFTDDAVILGTATGETLFGRDGAKEILESDWKYWGDVTIDPEAAVINEYGDAAAATLRATVRYKFEHTPERCDRYVNYVKEAALDKSMPDRQKLAFINWVLTLNYHQRSEKLRIYDSALLISAEFVRKNNDWRVAQLHFSAKKSCFPDERLEASGEFCANFDAQKEQFRAHSALKYPEIAFDETSVCLTPEGELLSGNTYKSIINDIIIDKNTAIVQNIASAQLICALGIHKLEITETDMTASTLTKITAILNSPHSSPEKLFLAHKETAYVMRELSIGKTCTYPVRITMLALNGIVKKAHISYPFYWIFEGKL